MQQKHLIMGIIALAVILPVLWYTLSPLFVDKVVNEDIPIGVIELPDSEIIESVEEPKIAEISHEGSFADADTVHKVSGKAMVISQDDLTYLRLEDFQSTNGPDLYVYLSADGGNEDFVSLGKLKGNIGNQNYLVPEGVDLEKYDNVLIWCQRFGVLFGSAEIKKQ